MSQIGDPVKTFPYLVKNRNGNFYYRFVLPLGLLQRYPFFKRELRISLKTKSPKCKDALLQWHLGFIRLFEFLMQNSKFQAAREGKPTPDEGGYIFDEELPMELAEHLYRLIERKALVKSLIEGCESLTCSEFSFSSFRFRGSVDIENLLDIAEQYRRRPGSLTDNFFSLPLARPRHYHLRSGKIISASDQGRSVLMMSRNPEIVEQLSKRFITYEHGKIDEIIALIVWNSAESKKTHFIVDYGEIKIAFENVVIDEPSDIDDLRSMLAANRPSPETIAPVRVSLKPDFSPEREMKLSQLIETFLPQRIKNLARSGNKQTAVSALTLMREFFEDDPLLTSIDRERADELIRATTELPPNRNKLPNLRDLPLKKVLSMSHEVTLSPNTIGSYITEYRKLFAYAESSGYVSNNIFGKAVHVKKYRRASQEQANRVDRRFTQEQLDEIFCTKFFTGEVNRMYKFWVPLVCLYTGARVSEAAQLKIKDIVLRDGIWCFDFNARNKDKSIKNLSSYREVPIHDDLIKLGLISYVEAVQQLSAERKTSGFKTDHLWWDIRVVQSDYSNTCGKHFDTLEKELSFKNEGTQFHGFRHSFTYMMKNSGVDESTYGALLGHDISMRSGGMYGGIYTTSTLKVAIDRIKPLPDSIIRKMVPAFLPSNFKLKSSRMQRKFERQRIIGKTPITDTDLKNLVDSW